MFDCDFIVSISRSNCCFQSTSTVSSCQIEKLDLWHALDLNDRNIIEQKKLNTWGICIVTLFGKRRLSCFRIFGVSLFLSCILPKLSCKRNRFGTERKSTESYQQVSTFQKLLEHLNYGNYTKA